MALNENLEIETEAGLIELDRKVKGIYLIYLKFIF